MPSAVKRAIRIALPDRFLPFARAAIRPARYAGRLIDAHLTDRELRRRPVAFIIAGVQKGGSSALASFLRQHPEIAFCSVKEPDYFLRYKNMSLSQYHRLYPRPRGRIAGEASIGVLYEATAVQKLKAYNPAMKIILVIRNPVERAYSHYMMHVNKHGLRVPFLECIRLGELPVPEAPIHRCHSIFANYIDWSRYTDRIRYISKEFDDILLLRHEDMENKHDETLKSVFEFLDVEPSFKVEQRKVHTSPAYSMPAEARLVLEQRLSAEIDKLEALTEWDLSDWRTRK